MPYSWPLLLSAGSAAPTSLSVSPPCPAATCSGANRSVLDYIRKSRVPYPLPVGRRVREQGVQAALPGGTRPCLPAPFLTEDEKKAVCQREVVTLPEHERGQMRHG
jgi:hypothetical protein